MYRHKGEENAFPPNTTLVLVVVRAANPSVKGIALLLFRQKRAFVFFEKLTPLSKLAAWTLTTTTYAFVECCRSR